MNEQREEIPSPTDDEVRKLVHEFVIAEREGLRLMNEVRRGTLDKLLAFFRTSETRVLTGEKFTIKAVETPIWNFEDRRAAVAILAQAGQLDLVLDPEQAKLAKILDHPDLAEDTRDRLRKLAHRGTSWNFDIEETAEPEDVT